jgi:hypothetical protein
VGGRDNPTISALDFGLRRNDGKKRYATAMALQPYASLKKQTFPKDILSFRRQNRTDEEEAVMNMSIDKPFTFHDDLSDSALAVGIAMHLDAAISLLPETHEAAESLRCARRAALKLVRRLQERTRAAGASESAALEHDPA